MKYLRIGWVLITAIMFFPAMLRAQSNTEIVVKAIVYGSGKTPLEGALIRSVEDDENEAATDEKGAFEIKVPFNSEIAVSAVGYKTQHVKATSGLTEIILTAVDIVSNANVLFRIINQKDLLGGVNVVDVKELIKKNYTTGSLEGMEALVPGYNGNSMWGMGSYFTLVDGIPRDANNVLPTEIDQITFLKSAAAVVLYGTQAAKGAILITTKRGEANNRQTNVTFNTGINIAKRFPEYLGSAEYMTLYNEARSNDGLAPLFTDTEIYNFASGKNPYRYPNLNFYSPQYIKRSSHRHDITAEISGGNERARYYTNINYYTTGTMLNFGEGKNNDRTNRFSVRGNIDVTINPFIYSKIDMQATFYDDSSPNSNFWSDAATVRPNRFAPLIPLSYIEEKDMSSWGLLNNSNYIIDGKYFLGGTQLEQTNSFAAMYAGAYNQFISRQFQFNPSVGADLRNVAKGLKFQTDFAIDYRSSYTQSYNNTYGVFSPGGTNVAGNPIPGWYTSEGKDYITMLTQYGQDVANGVQNISGTVYRQTLALSSYLSYDNVIAKDHHFTGLLVANGFQQTTSAEYHAQGSVNMGLQLGYVFRDKYMFDFSGALVHSAKLPDGKRKAFNPTVSLGWRLSKEKFLSASSIVNDLKFVASAGIINTDIDIADYYMYLGYYRLDDDGPWWGWDGGGYSGRITESRGGSNPEMTFPKRYNLTAGFEGLFFENALGLEANFFTNRMTDILVNASTMASVVNPSWFNAGNSIFGANVNRDIEHRSGFDFAARFNKKLNEVKLTLGVTGTYYVTKSVKKTEIQNEDYLYRQGKILDGIWGYENLGFFKDQDDINNSPVHSLGVTVKPGDLKYKDQNGDGIINVNDQVLLGKGGWYGAPFNIGMHLTAQWKKLTVFALGLGRFGADAVKNGSYFWIGGEDKYSEVVRNRWTPETAANATYPRLTTQSKAHNFVTSDFWMYKSNRFDLTKIQVTYDLSGFIRQSSFIKDLNIYLSGANLLTLSKERELMERNIGSAPQVRFYNFGIRALF